MQNYRLTFTIWKISEAAAEFLRITKGSKHFAFYGGMGVGKTTFIKAICQLLGTVDLVSSPTFAIINDYSTHKGDTIYHFDFYRIKTSAELLDIGFYDYCSSDAYGFIEWPDKAEDIIPDDFIRVYLEEDPDETRILSFSL